MDNKEHSKNCTCNDCKKSKKDKIVISNSDTADSYNTSNSSTNSTINSSTSEEAILSEVLELADNNSVYYDEDDYDEYLGLNPKHKSLSTNNENPLMGDDYDDEFEEDEDDYDYQEPEDDDIVISSSGHLGGKCSVGVVNGRHLGEFSDEDDAYLIIKSYTKQKNYSPDIWRQDDHGGFTNISQNVYNF